MFFRLSVPGPVLCPSVYQSMCVRMCAPSPPPSPGALFQVSQSAAARDHRHFFRPTKRSFPNWYRTPNKQQHGEIIRPGMGVLLCRVEPSQQSHRRASSKHGDLSPISPHRRTRPPTASPTAPRPRAPAAPRPRRHTAALLISVSYTHSTPHRATPPRPAYSTGPSSNSETACV